MTYKTFIISCVMGCLFCSPVFAQDPESSAQTSLPPELIQECLNLKHGIMMRCIQKGIEAIKEEMERLTEPVKTEDTKPWQAPEEYQQKKNLFPPNKENILRGQKIYSFHCSGCHGLDGRGSGTLSLYFQKQIADLTNPQLNEKTDGALFWKITEGSWPMPAFWKGDTLSEQELWELINFMRSLSGPAADQP